MESLNEFLREWNSSDDYIVAHTSGSTGKPKEIRLPKADMRVSARATNTFFRLGEESRAALPLLLDYIAGKMMAVRAMEGNYPLDIIPVSNDISLPDNGRLYNLIPVVPSQLPSLLKQKEYASRIENLLIGGAQPDKEICNALHDAGYKAFISFSTDEDNRLIIEAPAFSFKRLKTNDIVELIDSSSFRWRGRFDNAINSGGLKLLPEELEKMYAPYLTGVNFYVVGRKHDKWGECICLVIEGDADGEELINLIRKHIDHRMCPKYFETAALLPRTINGKIRRI